MTGADVAAAAHGFLGVRFRCNGRDAVTGLDCLGLVAVALGQGASVPARASLRQGGVADADALAADLGLVLASGSVTAGDILLVRCSPVQLHLLVATSPDRFVHAHAGLRRVVSGACDPGWQRLRHWRLPNPE